MDVRPASAVGPARARSAPMGLPGFGEPQWPFACIGRPREYCDSRMQVTGHRRVPNSLGVLGPLDDEPKGAQLRPLRRSRLPVLLKPLESVRKGRIVRGLVRELADQQRERLGVPKPIREFPPVTSAVLPLRRCMTLPLPVLRSLASTPFRCPALSRPAAGADVAG